jgi:hypothetical protein
MLCVRSTFTRRTGRTTVNLLVKQAETSSPRDAIAAISSAVGALLDVFGIASCLISKITEQRRLRRHPVEREAHRRI